MLRRSSYPRDIAIISALFIFLIIFLAVINLVISIQVRNEYLRFDKNRIASLAQVSAGYLKNQHLENELYYLFQNLHNTFRLDRLIINDSLGNRVFDSWQIPSGLEYQQAIDYSKIFDRLPEPGEICQKRDRYLYLDPELRFYLYVSMNPEYAGIDRVFRWHLIYVTASLIFVSFLGVFLIRNLFMPMRYVANLAKDLGIEMKREDFVAITFNEILKKLKTKERELVQFAAYIAHEFRNSLAAIAGLSRLVEKGKKPAADIIKECQAMENLIATLLEYSRPLKLEMSLFNIERLIDDAISKTHIPKRIAIEKRYLGSIQLKGDYELLLIAVSNLLKNSVEAIAKKGSITIETQRDGEMVFVAIADTGCGMDKEQLRLLFNPFYSDKKAGTGIGLSYVKKVLELHNARIEVESTKNKGTKFTLKFPGVKS